MAITVDDKYLPELVERKLFLNNKIKASKDQMYGGQVEILMAGANGETRTAKQTEDMMEQIMVNIDIMQTELDKIGQ